jgi:hypothetical protein
MNAPLLQLDYAQEQIALTLLQAMRFDLYETLPTPEGCAYRRDLGTDHPTIEAECGVLVFSRIRYFPDRTFDLLDEGEAGGVLSSIIEVFDADAVTTIDLCAWPLHRPDKIATALRRADGLGMWRVANPVSYFAGQALRVYRTPESWLRSHCQGVVILNPASAPHWLAAAPGRLLAEDLAHGRELARMLHPYFDPRRILAPLSREAA